MRCVTEAIQYQIDQYKIRRGDYDEESDVPNSVRAKGYEWMGKVKPYSEELQIVFYKHRTLNKYGLQAKVNGEWVDMMMFDDGHDDCGKLSAARWRRLSDVCSWSLGSITLLKNAILHIPEVPEAVSSNV